MKRYPIPIVIILLVILGMIGGCSQKPEQMYKPSSKDVSKPKVIEKDVEIKFRDTEIGWLSFYLRVGDRVEGEVSIDEGAFKYFVIAEARDPYENVVVQTSGVNRSGQYFKNSGFPWRFAFIAYTEGEYKLGAFFSGQVQGLTPSAHLKITLYEGELSPTSQSK